MLLVECGFDENLILVTKQHKPLNLEKLALIK